MIIKFLKIFAFTIVLWLVALNTNAQVCNFMATQQTGCAPINLLMSDVSTPQANIVNRLWTVTRQGGGVLIPSTTGANFSYLFTVPGCYDVRLKVYFANGDSCERFVPCYLNISDKPLARLSVLNPIVCPGTPVTFNFASIPNCGTLSGYQLEVRPGTILTGPGSATSLQYVYTQPGTYNVFYRVNNSCVCSDDTLLTAAVTVRNAPVINTMLSPNPSSCSSPATINFTSTVTSPGTVNYQWAFRTTTPPGGTWTNFGTNSANTNRSFTSGQYDIRLTVTDPVTLCSKDSIITGYVGVGQGAQPVINSNVTGGCSPLTVNFSTPSGPISYSWTFPGGTPSTSSSQNPSVSYTTSGVYNVSLTVGYPGGCFETRTNTNMIRVSPGLAPFSITLSDSVFCRRPDSLFASYNGPVCGGCSYQWSTNVPAFLQPLTPTTILNPIYIVASTFNAVLQLTVSDSLGCSRSNSRSIISSNYTANFQKDTSNRCAPVNITFTNTTSQTASPIVSSLWTFNGLTPSSHNGLNPPPINFPSAGCYPVSLTVVNQKGCTATRNDTICVGQPVTNSNITITPSIQCYEEEQTFFRVCAGSNIDSIRFFPEAPTNFTTSFSRPDSSNTNCASFTYTYQDLGSFKPCWRLVDRGCVSPLICATSDSVKINGPATAFRDSVGCNNRNRIFYKNQTVDADSFVWLFYNGTTSNDTNPTFNYPSCGSYPVTLFSFNRTTGCQHQFTDTTRVGCPPSVLVRNPIGCAPALGQFEIFRGANSPNTSQLSIDYNISNGFQWEGANYSPALNQTAYNTGIYGIAVRFIYVNGCIDTVIVPNAFTVSRNNSSFTLQDSTGCAPFTLNATNTTTPSLSTITRSVWYFGNGDSIVSTPGGSVSYTYTQSGIYTVCLRQTSSSGCIDNFCRQITVNQINSNFTVSDTFSCTNPFQPISFTNTSTGIGSILYSWSTPDGDITSATTANHSTTFNIEGRFPVQLVASNISGVCRDTTIQFVTVRNPKALFFNPDTFANCPPLLANFVDSSRNNICGWIWDFGDGTTLEFDRSNYQNVSRFYNRPGTFIPSLTVISCDSCQDTYIGSPIKVEGPQAQMSINQLAGCPCTEVTYTISTINALNLVMIPGCNKPFHIEQNINPRGTIAAPRVFVYKDTFCNVEACRPQLILDDGFNCQFIDTIYDNIYIDTPLVNFAFSKLGLLCDTGTFCFTNQTTTTFDSVTITDYLWDFGDGNTSILENPCHLYTIPGNYVVSLTATNSLQCSKVFSRSLYVPSAPNAIFTLNDSSGCVNNGIRLWDLSTSDDSTFINSWSWSIPPPASPPNIYNTQNVSRLIGVGVYDIVLTVTDTFGCVDTALRTVTVRALPPANAGPDTSICNGDTIQLSGTGGIVYTWHQASNISDTAAQNPNIWPNSTTSYIVEVTDVFNCRNKDTVLVTVSDIIANFEADTVCLNQTTNYVSSSSTTNATLISYQWNFGDLNSGSGSLTNHTYVAPNIYNASLTVTNSLGCIDDTIKPVYVSPIPVADFSFRDTCDGVSIVLSDLSIPGFGVITNWNWDFGDGNNSPLQNPTHLYSTHGSYSVRLIVTNSTGCQDTVVKTLTIFQNPTANFTVDSVCLGVTSIFTNASTIGSSPIVSNLWDFDLTNPNTTTASTTNTTFDYLAAGSNQVRLTVTDQNGCSSSTDRTAFVFAIPTANYSFSNTCIGQTVNFTNQSTNGSSPIVINTWFFSAAPNVVNTQNTSRVFGSLGTFPVLLVVQDSKGCIDSSLQQIEIFDLPNAAINVPRLEYCEGVQIPFTSGSTAGVSSPISQYIWDMQSDGVTEYNTQNVNHTYNSDGTFRVTHIVVDNNLCSDTAFVSMRIFNNPTASFSSDVKCEGFESIFTSNSIPGDAPVNQLNWTFPGPVSSNSNPARFTFSSGGTYQVTLQVTDQNGCTNQISNNVSIDISPTVSISPNDTTICLGQSANLTIDGSFSNVQWTPTTWINNLTDSSILVTPLNTIDYVVTVFNGTCDPSRDTVRVTVLQPIPIELSASPERIFIGINSNLLADYVGVVDSLVWSPDSSLSCRNCNNPVATPTSTTTYTATLFYSANGVGCENSSSITITIIETCGDEIVYVPNTFTPNSDGFNDVFRIRGNGIQRVNYFRIYDRWGKLVFEGDDLPPNSSNAHWNGKLYNEGQELNPDVFVYSYEITCINGDTFSGKGNITLIR
jgi:gliding motility-associated-like protein